MKLWIPDSTDFESFTAQIQQSFPDLLIQTYHQHISETELKDEEIMIVEIPEFGGEHRVKVVFGGGVQKEYRLMHDQELLFDEFRKYMEQRFLREPSQTPDVVPDVPDLGEEVFTLGGGLIDSSNPIGNFAFLEVGTPNAEVLKKQDDVPREMEHVSGVSHSQPEAPLSEQITSPGVLRRNTVVASLDEVEKLFQGEYATPEFTLPQWNGNTVLFLLDLHRQRFSGQMEIALAHFHLVFSWIDGRIAHIEGLTPILVSLLHLGSDVMGMDLLRTVSDPIEWAQRRRLIAPNEAQRWFDRCRREAIRMAVSARRIPMVSVSHETTRNVPTLLDPRGPLFAGIMEYMGADEACALCDGKEPQKCVSTWNDLFADPDIDPLWIRALHLFAGGFSWEESCIRAGMGMPESWKLAYASRLFGFTEPQLPVNPTAEIFRRRFRRFEESLHSGNSLHPLGEDPVAARHMQQEMLLLFTQLPDSLRLLLSGDFEKLKKSIDKALSLLPL